MGGGGDFVVLPFFVAAKIHKNSKYFNFKQVQKKFEPTELTKNFLPKKVVTKLSEIWVGDPEKIYPGSRGQRVPDPESATLV